MQILVLPKKHWSPWPSKWHIKEIKSDPWWAYHCLYKCRTNPNRSVLLNPTCFVWLAFNHKKATLLSVLIMCSKLNKGEDRKDDRLLTRLTSIWYIHSNIHCKTKVPLSAHNILDANPVLLIYPLMSWFYFFSFVFYGYLSGSRLWSISKRKDIFPPKWWWSSRASWQSM